MTDTFTYGDYVTIGKNKLTWKIVGRKQVSQTWVLESGQTGIRRLARTEELVLHTAATKIPKMIGEAFDPE